MLSCFISSWYLLQVRPFSKIITWNKIKLYSFWCGCFIVSMTEVQHGIAIWFGYVLFHWYDRWIIGTLWLSGIYKGFVSVVYRASKIMCLVSLNQTHTQKIEYMKQGWIKCLMISSNRRTYYSYYNWSRPNNLVKRLFGLQICGLGSGNSENKGGICLIQNPREKKKEMFTYYGKLWFVVSVGLL